MSKRKGMSLEEKRTKILGIYHSTKDVYSLKEIEAQGAKLGVVQQSIKEVNQSLVDDGLVDSDKIGAGNFFWSFPGKALNQKKTQLKTLETEIFKLKTEVEALEKKVAALSQGRQETKERKEMLAEYQALTKIKAEQLLELQKYADNDPEKLERLRKNIQICKIGANRWTDNIFSIKNYLVKKMHMPSKDVDRFLELTDDFDYIE